MWNNETTFKSFLRTTFQSNAAKFILECSSFSIEYCKLHRVMTAIRYWLLSDYVLFIFLWNFDYAMIFLYKTADCQRSAIWFNEFLLLLAYSFEFDRVMLFINHHSFCFSFKTSKKKGENWGPPPPPPKKILFPWRMPHYTNLFCLWNVATEHRFNNDECFKVS